MTTGFCVKSHLLAIIASARIYALLLILILTTHVSATLALGDVRSLISNPSFVYANQPSLRVTTVVYVFRLLCAQYPWFSLTAIAPGLCGTIATPVKLFLILASQLELA